MFAMLAILDILMLLALVFNVMFQIAWSAQQLMYVVYALVPSLLIMESAISVALLALLAPAVDHALLVLLPTIQPPTLMEFATSAKVLIV